MKKIIEILKRLFGKRPLALNQAEPFIYEKELKKQTFLDSVKFEKTINNILLLQKKIEDGTLEEGELSIEQELKIKDLYCEQIKGLVDSINNYKLKLSSS